MLYQEPFTVLSDKIIRRVEALYRICGTRLSVYSITERFIKAWLT